MLSLDYSRLFQIKKTHGISEKEFKSVSDRLSGYLLQIKARNQGFYRAIDDAEVVRKIHDFAERVKGQYDHIVVLGIGGSALGTRALQQSLTPMFVDEVRKKVSPRLHILDNIDPFFISQLEPVIDYQKTLFVVVSKSGTTLETLAHYFYFRHKLESHGLIARDHVVVVTDSEKGFLHDEAVRDGLTIFPIPEDVGGRFSVLTSVGLLPAKLVGIDIDALLRGARKMRDAFLSDAFNTNVCFQLAALKYLSHQKKKTINVLMPYSQKLIRFAEWYAQLLAESTGKRFNDQGKEIFTGITPLSALGATDQHSLCQLFNEGPHDKLFIFIEVDDLGRSVPIPVSDNAYSKLGFSSQLSFNRLMDVEREATISSLTRNDRPCVVIKVDRVDEETLGQLFMLFQGSVSFLGEFFGINVFNQPGVELSKQLTRQFLSSSD